MKQKSQWQLIMNGEKYTTGNAGGESGPSESGAHSVPKKKQRGLRCSPRIDLASMNRIFMKQTEYIPVKITSTGNQKCLGRMINISESGCLVAVPVSLQEGETIMVSFMINQHPIAARATVMRTNSHDGVNQVGIQFAVLADVSRDFLRALSDVAMLKPEVIGRMKKLLFVDRSN